MVFEVDAEQLAEVVDAHPGRDADRAVVELFDLGALVGVGLVGDLADDLLEDVLDGEQARGAAVLVDRDGHVVVRALHLLEQLVEPLGVGDEAGLVHQRVDDGARAVRVHVPGHEVLDVDDADDVVDGLVDHREPGEAGAQGQCEGLADGLGALDPDDLGARHHDLAGDGVAELEHRVDHLALGVLDDAAFLGEVDELAQLDLGAERAFPEALAGGDGVADEDQQPGQRAEDRAEDADGPGDVAADAVRVLAAEGARADADEDVAHDDHDDRRDQHGEAERPQPRADEDGDQHGGRELAAEAQQEQQVDVAGAARR